MTTYVALLRGINVGGHRKVPMAELRALCADSGFDDARSYIQSGNLVLSSADAAAAVEATLETAIERRFGFPVDVVVRDAVQWAAYVSGNPLAGEAEAASNFVMLALAKAPLAPAAVAGLRERADAGERIEAQGDALWLYFPDGAGRSKLGAALSRLPCTARNWRTVLALADMTA